ncbi:hypothetical protein [Methylobacterium organophilum]|uniref:Ribbon-helix-helix protein CopG domain-containing protein n=1 Tax=Methylobacterium organophilum TaxID=410 RepID=A0ABQ4T876_METOR|nr:hypothetical protein [Methylobacterium organophilum]GJE27523.1 hypothetical protein LKMONMHP_2383 [Methylobacterium organophilum]
MKKEKSPKGEQVTVYLEPGLRAVLKVAAAEKGSSASSLVEAALRAYLRKLGFQITSRGPTADATAAEDTVAPPALATIEKTLADHAAALQAIQEQLASLKAARAPAPLAMPEGEFTKVESIILDMICAGGLKGASAADIKRRLDAKGIAYGPRRAALSNLHKQGILRRWKWDWRLVEASAEGKEGGPRDSGVLADQASASPPPHAPSGPPPGTATRGGVQA